MHILRRLTLVQRSLVNVVLLCSAFSFTQASALPVFFKVVSIADTSEHFFSRLNFPCINNLSRIAFTGRLSSGVEGAFSRVNLGGFDTLADSGTSNFEDFGLDCSINHNAMIEFTALKKVSDGFDTVVLRGTGNSSSPLIDSTGTFESFSSFQLNIVGKSVLGARRASDGANVILVKGAGSLTGPERVIAPGTGAIAMYSNFARNPVINSSGTVAFVATKTATGREHILTVDESGLVTQLLNEDGPFLSVDDVIINNSGSIAFNGLVGGGERGVWRLDNVNGSWNIAKLASSTSTPCVEFHAVSISDLGVVAFNCRDFNSFSYVYFSDQRGLHRVLGLGSQILGRSVVQATIGREAINSDRQMAVLVDFADNSSAIVRMTPTYLPPDLAINISGALQLATSTDGGNATVSTTVGPRSKLLLLSFDVAASGHPEGELKILLGDKLLHTLAISPASGHQHVSIPVDLRKDSAQIAALKQLRFEFSGKAGSAVQVSNISMPGALDDSINTDIGHWRVETKGGQAAMTDTTAFPLKVSVSPQQNNHGAGRTSVVISSSEGFDATHDIDRDKLLFSAVASGKPIKNAGCKARDVDADKLPDLVCDLDVIPSTKGKTAQEIRVEGVSVYGWNIYGVSNSSRRSPESPL